MVAGGGAEVGGGMEGAQTANLHKLWVCIGWMDPPQALFDGNSSQGVPPTKNLKWHFVLLSCCLGVHHHLIYLHLLQLMMQFLCTIPPTKRSKRGIAVVAPDLAVAVALAVTALLPTSTCCTSSCGCGCS